MADPSSPTDADALRALEQRLERATLAAERLLAGAREPLAQDDENHVPPRGWQRRAASAADSPSLGGWIDPEDARLLLAVLAELRERVPPELERRVVVALRELLVALRALLDWCVERAERRAAPPAEVQDIPIL
jgi:hypothetical protein